MFVVSGVAGSGKSALLGMLLAGLASHLMKTRTSPIAKAMILLRLSGLVIDPMSQTARRDHS
jgi:excinuclease UvrABC ATPase subunit